MEKLFLIKEKKTITVEVEIQKQHAKYKKMMKWHKKMHVHDEKNECKIGDVVEVTGCRPISKTKTWRLIKILSHQS